MEPTCNICKKQGIWLPPAHEFDLDGVNIASYPMEGTEETDVDDIARAMARAWRNGAAAGERKPRGILRDALKIGGYFP